MSIREFAAHLGVSERMISKWEAGSTPRPVNQAALDTCLARSDPDTQARFVHLTGGALIGGNSDSASVELIGSSQRRHPLDGTLMGKVEGRGFQYGPSNEPGRLPTAHLDVSPAGHAEYAR